MSNSSKKRAEDPKNLDGTIALFNRGIRTDEVWQRLDLQTEGRAVLKLVGSTLDAGAVEKALGFARRNNRAVPGHKTAAALRAELTQEHDEADPLTGEALFEGQTGDGADWSPVSADDRAAVALGVLQGEALLRAMTSELVIHALATGGPPTKRLRDAWAALDKGGELAARVRARLVVRPAAQEAPAPPPFVPDAGHAPTAPQERCAADTAGYGCPGTRGSCARPGEVGRCGRVVLGEAPRRSCAPIVGVPVFITHSDRDAPYGAALRTSLRTLEHNGLISVTMSSDVLGGTPRDAWIESRISSAGLVLAIWSSDVSDKLAAQVRWGADQGVRTIPILARPCLLPDWLRGKAALPNKPMRGPGDDEAWVEVAEGVERAARTARLKPRA